MELKAGKAAVHLFVQVDEVPEHCAESGYGPAPQQRVKKNCFTCCCKNSCLSTKKDNPKKVADETSNWKGFEKDTISNHFLFLKQHRHQKKVNKLKAK